MSIMAKSQLATMAVKPLTGAGYSPACLIFVKFFACKMDYNRAYHFGDWPFIVFAAYIDAKTGKMLFTHIYAFQLQNNMSSNLNYMDEGYLYRFRPFFCRGFGL